MDESVIWGLVSMLCKNGFGLGMVVQGNLRGSQKRFFSLFYEWSSIACVGSSMSMVTSKFFLELPKANIEIQINQDEQYVRLPLYAYEKR